MLADHFRFAPPMEFLESDYMRNAGVGSRGVAVLITIRTIH
jgi:hypothetical protein